MNLPKDSTNQLLKARFDLIALKVIFKDWKIIIIIIIITIKVIAMVRKSSLANFHIFLLISSNEVLPKCIASCSFSEVILVLFSNFNGVD